ncbi:MAG: hypothetical protein ACE365_07760 [Gammaproteobacteria bacterium]
MKDRNSDQATHDNGLLDSKHVRSKWGNRSDYSDDKPFISTKTPLQKAYDKPIILHENFGDPIELKTKDAAQWRSALLNLLFLLPFGLAFVYYNMWQQTFGDGETDTTDPIDQDESQFYLTLYFMTKDAVSMGSIYAISGAFGLFSLSYDLFDAKLRQQAPHLELTNNRFSTALYLLYKYTLIASLPIIAAYYVNKNTDTSEEYADANSSLNDDNTYWILDYVSALFSSTLSDISNALIWVGIFESCFIGMKSWFDWVEPAENFEDKVTKPKSEYLVFGNTPLETGLKIRALSLNLLLAAPWIYFATYFIRWGDEFSVAESSTTDVNPGNNQQEVAEAQAQLFLTLYYMGSDTVSLVANYSSPIIFLISNIIFDIFDSQVRANYPQLEPTNSFFSRHIFYGLKYALFIATPLLALKLVAENLDTANTYAGNVTHENYQWEVNFSIALFSLVVDQISDYLGYFAFIMMGLLVVKTLIDWDSIPYEVDALATYDLHSNRGNYIALGQSEDDHDVESYYAEYDSKEEEDDGYPVTPERPRYITLYEAIASNSHDWTREDLCGIVSSTLASSDEETQNAILDFIQTEQPWGNQGPESLEDYFGSIITHGRFVDAFQINALAGILGSAIVILNSKNRINCFGDPNQLLNRNVIFLSETARGFEVVTANQQQFEEASRWAEKEKQLIDDSFDAFPQDLDDSHVTQRGGRSESKSEEDDDSIIMSSTDRDHEEVSEQKDTAQSLAAELQRHNTFNQRPTRTQRPVSQRFDTLKMQQNVEALRNLQIIETHIQFIAELTEEWKKDKNKISLLDNITNTHLLQIKSAIDFFSNIFSTGEQKNCLLNEVTQYEVAGEKTLAYWINELKSEISSYLDSTENAEKRMNANRHLRHIKEEFSDIKKLISPKLASTDEDDQTFSFHLSPTK